MVRGGDVESELGDVGDVRERVGLFDVRAELLFLGDGGKELKGEEAHARVFFRRKPDELADLHAAQCDALRGIDLAELWGFAVAKVLHNVREKRLHVSHGGWCG